jgi:hypothetical protein
VEKMGFTLFIFYSGVLLYNSDFLGIIQQFLEILVIFGGYWVLLEARSWGGVGRWLPTSDIYKPRLLEDKEECHNRFILNIFQDKVIFM